MTASFNNISAHTFTFFKAYKDIKYVAVVSGSAYADLTTKATDNIKTLGMGEFGSGTAGPCSLLCVGFANVTT